jgi:hypothetical protein
LDDENKSVDQLFSSNEAEKEAPVTAPHASNLPFADTEINLRMPSQQTFLFPSGVEISSEFDSGNLAKCFVDEEKPNSFTCWLAGDAEPYSHGKFWTWFYFSVKGVKSGETLTFNIKGMASQGKLYKMGLRPVYRIAPDSMKWKRQQGYLRWDQTETDGFCISF